MNQFTLWNEECLEVMKRIPDGSVDMVMADLPYQTTQNSWDCMISLPALWAAYRRVCKPRAAIVLTASQPFTSVLVCSNLPWFKYEWIWQKSRPSGHMNAKKQPMKEHESVCVFYGQQCLFNRQFTKGAVNHVHSRPRVKSSSANYGRQYAVTEEVTDQKNPKTILPFTVLSPTHVLHPTQKPVALMEYMIRTYTNPGDLVLDNCMGSGTTGVACMNLGRRFIGIEKDTEHGYFQIAEKRIREAQAKNAPPPQFTLGQQEFTL